MRSGIANSEAGKDIQFSSILSFGTLKRGPEGSLSGAGLEVAGGVIYERRSVGWLGSGRSRSLSIVRSLLLR